MLSGLAAPSESSRRVLKQEQHFSSVFLYCSYNRCGHGKALELISSDVEDVETISFRSY